MRGGKRRAYDDVGLSSSGTASTAGHTSADASAVAAAMATEGWPPPAETAARGSLAAASATLAEPSAATPIATSADERERGCAHATAAATAVHAPTPPPLRLLFLLPALRGA